MRKQKRSVRKNCLTCGKELVRKSWVGSKRILRETNKRWNERKFCGNECRSANLKITNQGKNNYFYGKHMRPWNTNRAEVHDSNTTKGYIETRIWGSLGERIVKLKHRYVMELHIGRELRAEEVVHHIDGDIKNNDISNLMLFSNDNEHKKHHAMLRHTGVS
jgi:hypothetical protein